MFQRTAAISTIICIGLFVGVTFVRPAFAQTSVMAPQPAKLNYRLLSFTELAKLVEAGDAAALHELQKRYASKSDQPAAENAKKAHDPNAPVLGTSKGLGVLVTKPKAAKSTASASTKLRSIAEITRDIDDLQEKLKVRIAKIKAGDTSANGKKETARLLKKAKQLNAELEIARAVNLIENIGKQTAIVGDTAKIIKKSLTFVWTMKPAELKALAEKGDAEAQVELSHRYGDGKRGFEKDAIASFEWMLRASERGYGRAQNFTASKYHYGDGVAKDDTKAAYWLRKSAENGDKFAQFQLHKELEGRTYFVWGIFDKNLDQANYWLSKAVAQGFETAILHKKNEHAGE